jgi:hypothetical protein
MTTIQIDSTYPTPGGFVVVAHDRRECRMPAAREHGVCRVHTGWGALKCDSDHDHRALSDPLEPTSPPLIEIASDLRGDLSRERDDTAVALLGGLAAVMITPRHLC